VRVKIFKPKMSERVKLQSQGTLCCGCDKNIFF